ncbi:MAG: OsmC family protein [Candidatus Aminicenantia bacterium]
MSENILNATVKMVEGLQLIGYASSGHGVILDANKEIDGQDKGPRPMELALIALGGCTAMDVISIMKKKKQDLRGFEIKIIGKRAEEHPKVYTDIKLHYIFKGKNLSEEACKRSIELSHGKYCSLGAMLSKSAKIEYTWEIIEVD